MLSKIFKRVMSTEQPSTVKLIKNVFYSALPIKLGNCASYEDFGMPHLLEKGPI